MSRKYERIKTRWERYPRAVRLFLHALCSIGLSMTLLGFVVLWGFLGTLPVGPLPTWIVRGIGYAGITAACAFLVRALGIFFVSRRSPRHTAVLSIPLVACGLGLGVLACIQVQRMTGDWVLFRDFHRMYSTTTIYKLPAFDMTELEFYASWPLTLALTLFIINMVAATVCRIEFRLRNAGVLMAHGGIVTLALGTIIYAVGKQEGDVFLTRMETGGSAVDYFYDGTEPAVYMKRTDTGDRLMLPLGDLPRYHDSLDGRLKKELHWSTQFQEIFGPGLRASVDGFLAYGRLEQTWTEGDGKGSPNPAIEACVTVEGFPDHTIPFVMVAGEPDQRAYRLEFFDLEYVVGPYDSLLLAKLSTPFEGEHALIAEVPGSGYMQLFPVREGEEITLGATGYRLVVEELGEKYSFPVLTPGFEGVEPTVAVVRIAAPGGSVRQRWIFHPYVQLTQDFTDDSEAGRPRRLAPGDDLILTYLDASHDRFFIFQPDPESFERTLLLARRAGGQAELRPLVLGQGAELIQVNGHSLELIVDRFIRCARPELVGVPVPPAERDPKEEGTYRHALLGVSLLYSDSPGRAWSGRVWLPHVLYAEEAQDGAGPVRVEVPGYGGIELVFGRLRRDLPVSLGMKDFELVTYPGSDIPMDYRSTLLVTDSSGKEEILVTRLNHPVVRSGYKFSQSGWDPENQAFTILGVGNNPGVNLIASGALLTFLGIPFAFYLKPLLKKRETARRRAFQPMQEKAAS